MFLRAASEAIQLQRARNGGNLLGFNRTDSSDLIVVVLSPRWKSVEYDAHINSAAATWVTTIQELVLLARRL